MARNNAARRQKIRFPIDSHAPGHNAISPELQEAITKTRNRIAEAFKSNKPVKASIKKHDTVEQPA